MIKPEFWEDEVTNGVMSIQARLAYIASWNEADDEGRLRGNWVYLKGRLFPYDPPEIIDMKAIQDELCRLGKWVLYRVGEQLYMEIPKFKCHQKINRPSKSRIPPRTPENTLDSECSCNPHGIFSDGSLPKPETRNQKPESRITCSEPQGGCGAVAISGFPLKSKGELWDLPQWKLDEWRETWPDVDIEAECLKARQWLRDNPSKRKTERGMTKFLSGWISRAIDRGSAISREHEADDFTEEQYELVEAMRREEEERKQNQQGDAT